MRQRLLHLSVAVFLMSMPTVAVAVQWHHPLYLDGGGWWRGRIRVVVQNELQRPANGEPVAVKIGNGPGEADLANQRAEAIRVCNEQGKEMLFAIGGPEGNAILRGPIPAGGYLMLPAECGAKSSAAYYVYFDNPDATEVPDFLSANVGSVAAGFNNGQPEPKSPEGRGRETGVD